MQVRLQAGGRWGNTGIRSLNRDPERDFGYLGLDEGLIEALHELKLANLRNL